MAAGAAIERQQVPDADVVPDRLRRIDPVEAEARAALADVEGRAFAGPLHQLAQHRHDRLVHGEGRCIDGMQPRDAGTEAIAAVRQPRHQLGMDERREQPQHGALVLPGAPGELLQAKRFLAGPEGREQREGAIHRGGAAGRRRLLGQGLHLRAFRHGG